MTQLPHQFPPSLQEFLGQSHQEIAKIAPSTMLYYVSGSRREAALAGTESTGERYKLWASEGMLRCIDTIFQHGVKNLLMPMATPGLFLETTPKYRELLCSWNLKQYTSNFEAHGYINVENWKNLQLYDVKVGQLPF